MASAYQSAVQRPREWRRRVSIRTRVNLGPHWVDGKVLNISSRGMLLHSKRPLPIGAKVHIRQGSQAVAARVVWREGQRSGLECQAGIAINEWLAACEAPPPAERREARRAAPSLARREEGSRLVARRIEHIAVMAIALAISVSVTALAASALIEPFHAVEAALGR